MTRLRDRQEPRVTTAVVSPDPSRKPRLGWLTVGAMAVVALGSGPAQLMFLTLLVSLISPENFGLDAVADPISYVRRLAEYSVYGTIFSLPATLVHAVIVA